MALFKILKGDENKLPNDIHEGYMYITEDKGNIYVDKNSTERIQLSGLNASYLLDKDGKQVPADDFLLRKGGTLEGNLLIDNKETNQKNQPYIQWATIGANNNKPFTGFAKDQSDGTFIICSMENDTTTHGVKYYKNGLAIGGGSGNLLWKGSKVIDISCLASADAAGLIKVSSVNSSNITVNSESNVSGRYYPIELNNNGKAITNIPWTDTKVTQAAAITTNDAYPVLLGYSNTDAAVTNTVNKCAGVTINPSSNAINAGSMLLSGQLEFIPSTSSTHGGYIDFHFKGDSADYTTRLIENASGALNCTGTFTATQVFGAVWNDYAEYRDQFENIEPGYCVVSSNSGKVSKTSEKFQPCDGIVSDTYGFAIGENDNCKTPLAVAGRVLAYVIGNRSDYQVGDTVCAGPEGKVVKMTREEIKEYPDRVVGIVSEIPEYETWGSGNVQVNGRIWIKIK